MTANPAGTSVHLVFGGNRTSCNTSCTLVLVHARDIGSVLAMRCHDQGLSTTREPFWFCTPASSAAGSAQTCASVATQRRTRGCRGQRTERRLEVPSRRTMATLEGIEDVERPGAAAQEAAEWEADDKGGRPLGWGVSSLDDFDGAECRVECMMRRNQPNDIPAEARAGTFRSELTRSTSVRVCSI